MDNELKRPQRTPKTLIRMAAYGSARSVPMNGTPKSLQAIRTAEVSQDQGVRDANGNVLNDGDSVTVIKDLKVKGSSLVVKGRNQSERHPTGGCGRWTQHLLQN